VLRKEKVLMKRCQKEKGQKFLLSAKSNYLLPEEKNPWLIIQRNVFSGLLKKQTRAAIHTHPV
jgi:hypothetical protein